MQKPADGPRKTGREHFCILNISEAENETIIEWAGKHSRLCRKQGSHRNFTRDYHFCVFKSCARDVDEVSQLESTLVTSTGTCKMSNIQYLMGNMRDANTVVFPLSGQPTGSSRSL